MTDQQINSIAKQIRDVTEKKLPKKKEKLKPKK